MDVKMNDHYLSFCMKKINSARQWFIVNQQNTLILQMSYLFITNVHDDSTTSNRTNLHTATISERLFLVCQMYTGHPLLQVSLKPDGRLANSARNTTKT